VAESAHNGHDGGDDGYAFSKSFAENFAVEVVVAENFVVVEVVVVECYSYVLELREGLS
jgi:hypothetical protein